MSKNEEIVEVPLKKIVIFGATGQTGQHLVRRALEENYYVRAFVRNSLKLGINKHDCLEIVQGDITDTEAVSSAIAGTDIVISVAGGPHKNSVYPRGFMLQFTKIVVSACKEHNVRRFIYQAGAFSPTPEQPLTRKVKIMRSVFGKLMGLKYMLQDNDSVINFLYERGQDLDWTVTRPGMLKDNQSSGNIVSGNNMAGGAIQFTDLAGYTLRLINDNDSFHKCPYPVYNM
jgi:uncharacterized protein